MNAFFDCYFFIFVTALSPCLASLAISRVLQIPSPPYMSEEILPGTQIRIIGTYSEPAQYLWIASQYKVRRHDHVS